MEKKALEVLKKFNDSGYSAYIVGGYVRDLLLGRKTNDIDICTSATPKEILKLFDNVSITDINYGSVVIMHKGIRFDITTYRKEIKYENNRKPVKIKYIKDLKKDLLRRDFTINTLCMDCNGNIIDMLNIRQDLDNKVIKTVGNPRYRIKEDSLRILRCIRFATLLDFTIDEKTKYYLGKYGYLLANLSSNRKKEELDKIFLSNNKEKGRRLLIELDLVNVLKINKLKDIVLCTDIIGIWCQLDVDDYYPFTKLEKEQMKLLRELLEYDELDNYLVYKYGLYLASVYGDIKGISRRKISTIYSSLPIYSRKEIMIKGSDISKLLDRKPGNYIKDIMSDIEKKIVNKELNNTYDDIRDYVIKNYK